MAKKVAFLGLGVMGYPMAGWLSRKDYRVTVYNRTTATAERWCEEYSGDMAVTACAAVQDAEIVFLCVGNDQDVEEVVLGEQGILEAMKPGSILVDHTTTSASLAKQIAAEANTKGIGFVDAPVSGGQQGAENGQLTVMCGGSEPDFAQVESSITSFAKAVQLMGPVGSGQLCKMVNQICIAGLVQGLAEGLNFAENAGLDAHQVIEVISKGAAQSWQMENRHKTMLAGEYEHGFAVQWMRKDLAFALQEAENNGSLLPVTRLVDSYYAEVQALGGNRWDTSSLLARLKSKNDIKGR
ncbi:NAD(P)-dependent oxidoreductase [Porticoccaceae bacterium]|nr:NAD(P)-dependent oxidoreductase [Porticoccaceae bacterium]MDB4076476.1 NAD(P)-dependent oxidoreductase [Porticoccaceae bacterium]MDB4308492.1 NAD(P)-dependent oxidoreductase [Porticoccaceae bacterium]MDB4308827.1 NAD(P)-dependent oxidoreductase [Porticoccaceae bacterium]